jgi:hypothetical protein
MKTLITALVITFIAAPGITQSALAASPNEVIVGGKNIGSDPDSNVRFQMRRDVGSEGFWSRLIAGLRAFPSRTEKENDKTAGHYPRGRRDVHLRFGRDSSRCQSSGRSLGERHREWRRTNWVVLCAAKDYLAYPRNSPLTWDEQRVFDRSSQTFWMFPFNGQW